MTLFWVVVAVCVNFDRKRSVNKSVPIHICIRKENADNCPMNLPTRPVVQRMRQKEFSEDNMPYMQQVFSSIQFYWMAVAHAEATNPKW